MLFIGSPLLVAPPQWSLTRELKVLDHSLTSVRVCCCAQVNKRNRSGEATCYYINLAISTASLGYHHAGTDFALLIGTIIIY
jgi:hypothetical protein